MFDENSLNDLANKIRTNVNRLVEKLKKEDIVGEESFSERLIQVLEDTIDGFKLTYSYPYSFAYGGTSTGSVTLTAERAHGPKFSARTLQSKGKGAEEKISGADIIIVYDSPSPYIEANKGMLIQAKLHDLNRVFIETKDTRLLKQCNDMLKITQHGFVFIYTADGILVFDAKEKLFIRENAMSIDDFLILFLMCIIGDHGINSKTKDEFNKLVEDRMVRHGLFIKANP